MKNLLSCFFLITIISITGCNHISSLFIDQKNPIWSLDFEDPSEPLLSWWDEKENISEYCNSEKAQGNYSLKLEARKPSMMQTVDQIAYLIKRSAESSFILIPGKKYKLSAFIKTQGNNSSSPDPMTNPMWHCAYVALYIGDQWIQIGVGENTDWQLIEKEFIAPSDYHGQFEIFISTTSDYAYFDNIKIEAIY